MQLFCASITEFGSNAKQDTNLPYVSKLHQLLVCIKLNTFPSMSAPHRVGVVSRSFIIKACNFSVLSITEFGTTVKQDTNLQYLSKLHPLLVSIKLNAFSLMSASHLKGVDLNPARYHTICVWFYLIIFNQGTVHWLPVQDYQDRLPHLQSEMLCELTNSFHVEDCTIDSFQKYFFLQIVFTLFHHDKIKKLRNQKIILLC